MDRRMTDLQSGRLSPVEYHVLLALSDGPLYGYAISRAVDEESDGALTPRAGSLYRVLARMITWGLAEDAATEAADGPHPGLARKYYALTPLGAKAVRREARRMRSAAALAEKRLGLAGKGA